MECGFAHFRHILVIKFVGIIITIIIMLHILYFFFLENNESFIELIRKTEDHIFMFQFKTMEHRELDSTTVEG